MPRFLVKSTQRPSLSAVETGRLYEAMNRFYSGIPSGVSLECDYVRSDRLGSYSVLAVPDRATLDRILAPFDGLVNLEVVEVLHAKDAMAAHAES